MDSTIRFIHTYPSAIPPVQADPSALGTIPAAAMRYCEAIRSASSFGWYAFPAQALTLMFDGVDTYMLQDEHWVLLESEHADDPDHCIGNPGYIQVWSGLLVETKPDWSVLIRPLANTTQSGQYSCFEGIVETDRYGPAPLFINLRLQVTNTPIKIYADEPLFQVQPVHRSCYASNTIKAFVVDDPAAMTADDWTGYRGTVRTIDRTADDHKLGQYATSTRKRAKQQPQTEQAEVSA